MKLFVGLGNPGAKYKSNRHNVGFMIVDKLAADYGFDSWKSKSGAEVSTGRIGMEKIIAAKPQSFMNKSGLPVAELARFYKIPAEDIYVFHDEIDIGEGRLRVKQGGGHGGHNGLRDIDRHMGKEYWRVRIGVGRPMSKEDVYKWVLNDFSRHDKDSWLDNLLDALSREAELLAAGDSASYMSRVAWRAPAPENDKSSNNDASSQNTKAAKESD